MQAEYNYKQYMKLLESPNHEAIMQSKLIMAMDNWMRENKRINDEYYCYANSLHNLLAHINNINNRNYLLQCNDDAYKLAISMIDDADDYDDEQ